MTTFKHSCVLFTRLEGMPMEFRMRPCPEKRKVLPLIEHGGGEVCQKAGPEVIRLVESGSKVLNINEDELVVSVQFIYDCVKQNRLLNVNNYLVKLNTLATSDISQSESSLYSKKTNDSKSRKQEKCPKPTKFDDQRIIDFILSHQKDFLTKSREDFNKQLQSSGIVSRNGLLLLQKHISFILSNIDSYNLQPETKCELKKVIQEKRTREDDMKIIQYVLNSGKYKELKSATFWREVISANVVSSSMTYLMDRFHHTILPIIYSYGFSENKIKELLEGMDNQEVHREEDDSCIIENTSEGFLASDEDSNDTVDKALKSHACKRKLRHTTKASEDLKYQNSSPLKKAKTSEQKSHGVQSRAFHRDISFSEMQELSPIPSIINETSESLIDFKSKWKSQTSVQNENDFSNNQTHKKVSRLHREEPLEESDEHFQRSPEKSKIHEKEDSSSPPITRSSSLKQKTLQKEKNASKDNRKLYSPKGKENTVLDVSKQNKRFKLFNPHLNSLKPTDMLEEMQNSEKSISNGNSMENDSQPVRILRSRLMKEKTANAKSSSSSSMNKIEKLQKNIISSLIETETPKVIQPSRGNEISPVMDSYDVALLKKLHAQSRGVSSQGKTSLDSIATRTRAAPRNELEEETVEAIASFVTSCNDTSKNSGAFLRKSCDSEVLRCNTSKSIDSLPSCTPLSFPDDAFVTSSGSFQTQETPMEEYNCSPLSPSLIQDYDDLVTSTGHSQSQSEEAESESVIPNSLQPVSATVVQPSFTCTRVNSKKSSASHEPCTSFSPQHLPSSPAVSSSNGHANTSFTIPETAVSITNERNPTVETFPGERCPLATMSWTSEKSSTSTSSTIERTTFLNESLKLVKMLEKTVSCISDHTSEYVLSNLESKLHKLNTMLYKPLIMSKVGRVLKKPKLTLADKSVLVRYLATVENTNPDQLMHKIRNIPSV